jgi:hypothetical protein
MIEMRTANADEMVLAFLQAEIDSPRFGPTYLFYLTQLKTDRVTLIDNCALDNAEQNRIRAELLGWVRGYQSNRLLFTGFPHDVWWRRVQIEREELTNFRYANEASLLDVSERSRRVTDGAKNFETGRASPEFSERVRGVTEGIRSKKKFPDLIAVDAGDKTYILVEGHTRATAYALTKPAYPIMVLIGSSPLIQQWAYF